MKRTFRSQLDFQSAIKVSAILGFGSGFLPGFIFLFGGINSGEAVQGMLGFIFAPFLSALGGLATAAIGFPFYYWYANKIAGQKISGKFAEVMPEPKD
ncbi:hypothetical protein [Bowmanella pacifica]|uniref:Uncharacterized protein n=1 Tax=Bowmanella pacifica TaxID=502051 RepID=A0A918DIW6_9ALTE|nr:hypothetical protein [Bowmanella pacifica]GGO67540.1 hypothetical protein GCM10010982_14240 [Bowmanella pacifica]